MTGAFHVKLEVTQWGCWPLPTVNEILNSKEEREVGKSQYAFEGGDAEIVAVVDNELAIKGEIVETH